MLFNTATMDTRKDMTGYCGHGKLSWKYNEFLFNWYLNKN